LTTRVRDGALIGGRAVRQAGNISAEHDTRPAAENRRIVR
jgi:hypothetical protein